MNLLQITSSEVYPPSTGGTHRSHGLLLSFINQCDSVVRYAQGSPGLPLTVGPDEIEIKHNYKEIRECGILSLVSKAPMLFGQPNILQGIPLRLTLPKILAKELQKADIVQVEGPWQMPGIAHHTPESTPLIFSSHNAEYEVFSGDDNTVTDSMFLRQLRRIEETSIKCSDLVICTTERDKDALKTRYSLDFPSVIVPNGTYESNIRDSFDDDLGTKKYEKFGVRENAFVGVFIGSGYAPNIDAVEQIINISNKLSNTDIEFQIVVCGSVCEHFTDSYENINMLGFVDDLESIYNISDFGLNPIRFGSGSNIKILDYMSRGLPVITTKFGSRGYRLVHKNNALISDLSSFHSEIYRLFHNHDLRARLQVNSHQYIEENHTWEDISANYRRNVKRLIR
ncbi:glycosyltransferase family 4 protein [Salinigranum marinum]|uniref:glycosyltransferase family 4 protein n=1 Tax=Salinigranum marinum TaxID=1515595 RepID=UPI002989E5C8|nr:glycosyltransferase family 4 protein [Salinigranum marinum]